MAKKTGNISGEIKLEGAGFLSAAMKSMKDNIAAQLGKSISASLERSFIVPTTLADKVQASQKAQIEQIKTIANLSASMGISVAEATNALKALATTMDGTSTQIQPHIHNWNGNTSGGPAQCKTCGQVWTPITLIESQPTQAGRLAYEIANMFRVNLSSAEHVVKCVRMNIVASPEWQTVRNEYNKKTQIRHLSSNNTLWVNHDTLEITKSDTNAQPASMFVPIKTKAGSTVNVKKPKALETPKPKQPEFEIVATQARQIILSDGDE